MTPPVHHDPDRILGAFFEAGPRHLSEALASAIREDVHHTRQRRGLPRWEGHVNRFAVTMAGLAFVAAAAIGLAILNSGPSGDVGPGASATPRATPSSAASTAPSAQLLAPLGYQAPGTIAFTRSGPSLRDGTGYLIAPDGSGETQVVVNGEAACCQVFSPDGSKVAIGLIHTGGSPGFTNLVWAEVVTLAGQDLAWIPRCGGCAFLEGLNLAPRAWSPDGTLVALEVWSDDDPTRNGMMLSWVSAAGWADQVAGNHTDVPIAFSPDSKRLLFVRMIDADRGTLMELSVPDLASGSCCSPDSTPLRGETREVGTPGMLTTVSGYFGAPASWSPDGSQIVFAAADPASGNGMRIWVVGADGGEPVPITAPAAMYTGAAWSPDGQWIAFDREGLGSAHDLFITMPDGSDETNLTGSFAPGVCCGRWSPDSSALLVAGTAGANDASYLFIVPIDGSPIRQVTTVPSSYWDFSWGPASR